MSQKDKWVRRFSVDETSRHKNAFTIYKITSVLFPIESPETMTVVSVWKRYSDVQRLHKSMRALHAGLHLRGAFPSLTRSSYFKRFQQEVIEERAKAIKALLEFIAEHKLLFTSTDFVNFLQTGYPEPETRSGSVINAIRSSLHLPIEETPPLEYQTSDDDSRSPAHTARSQPPANVVAEIDETDFSQIPIFEAADVEIRQTSPKDHRLTKSESFESINSLDSINSDLYSELDKMSIDKSKSSVKKTVLPDLINFDAPSTSRFEDYHTMPKTKSIKSNSETVSLNSTLESYDSSYRRSSSRVSMAKSVASLSKAECKTRTEDSYVFEAGYMLNLARRYEDMKEYQSAFECYKAGIEKMLIGVKSDTDSQRRALIKQKINKYLSYAEGIYKNHLSDAQEMDNNELRSWPLPDRCYQLHSPPAAMLRRPYSDLSQYRVLAVLGPSVALVLHSGTNTCRAMKVLQKVPHNLTEFDEYFLANTEETRQPVLPTVIPYMVPLHSYVETNNLIFLILAYAPGEKLFDYIKNYAKSMPNTPAREVNLENVFAEPNIKVNDVENDNVDSIIEIQDLNIELKVQSKNDTDILNVNEKLTKEDKDISIIDRLEQNIENNNRNVDTEMKTDDLENLEVNDLVINSQKLLLNVDKVLKEVPKSETTIVVSKEEGEMAEEVKTEVIEDVQNAAERRVDTSPKQDILKLHSPARRVRDVIPAATVRQWGAEILTALESLHNSGVVCIDLNPSNILLGERGQIILTYMYYYPGVEMRLRQLRARRAPDAYAAPELRRAVCASETGDVCSRVCDYWSYGAIMYWLICGVPLSHYHRSVFTSHTILQLPESLPVDEHSLLTQLLTFEPAERLGGGAGGAGGAGEIKAHPYFRHVDWLRVCHDWVPPD